MKKTFIILISILMVAGWAFSDTDDTPIEETRHSLILIMEIKGAISTLVADRVIDAVDQAEEEMADLLIITMDTPGGQMLSEKDVTKAIMNSSVPVAVYVHPVGASSTSAGVFISYSAHISAMAPGTNIGAAHAVMMGGGEVDSVMMEKIQNDAVSSIQAMAERYGRNAEWAEQAIRESVSITSTKALELGVIDLIAKDIDDLISKADAREVNTASGSKSVYTVNPVKKNIKKTFIQSILEILVDPTVVFALLAIGGLGITLEIYNPGSIFPGVVGGICIIMAAYGLRVLPINFAGVLLMLLAVLLFIMEIKIVSHGLLTVGGVVSLILGGMMLIDSADPDLRVSRTVIFSSAIVIGAFVMFAFYYAYRARIAQPTTGQEGLVGHTGVVKTKIDMVGYIHIAGELWEAAADEADGAIEVGEEVEVIAVDNLKMQVRRKK